MVDLLLALSLLRDCTDLESHLYPSMSAHVVESVLGEPTKRVYMGGTQTWVYACLPKGELRLYLRGTPAMVQSWELTLKR